MHARVARTIPIVVALAVAAALVYVAWKFDESLPKVDRARRVPIEELVAPDPLTAEERAALASRAPMGTTIELDRGAWVQVAGKDGKVVQQYAAQRIDPQPGAAMRMEEPRAVFYLDDGRLATIRAAAGRVHVPNRALESGAFSGAVVVRMYRPDSRGKIDLAKDSPALILEADDLEFDQVLGSLACPGPFRLTTDMLTFDGDGLELLLTPDGKTIQRLSVDHPLGPIVIDRARASGGRTASVMGRAMYDATPVSFVEPQSGARPAPAAVPVPAPVRAAAPASAQFYRLDLHDDVEVLRYSATDRAWTRGDLLTAIFTLESDLVSKEIAAGPTPAQAPEPPQRAPMMGMYSQLAAASIAQAGGAAQPQGDLIVVRFTGQLLLEPAAPGQAVPANPTDMMVAIDGRVVEIATDKLMALRSKEIDIDLVGAKDGTTAPALLVARGDVEATDSLQTVWCGALRAKFAPDAQAAKSAAVDPVLGAAKVERVDATESVQIQLKDGARVFANSMVAFPEAKTADLAGPDVMLVRSGVLIEGLASVHVDEVARSAAAPGGGRARNWSLPLLAGQPTTRVDRPKAPEGVPLLDAAWGGGMSFVDRDKGGAVLDLDGKVKVRAQPEPDEFDALDAMSVHLEFDRTGGEEVRPRRLLAKGDARLENQKWASAARSGEPRLFQVKAETVDYDAVAGEANIPCAGSALIYVPPGSSQDSRVAQGRSRDALVPGGGVEGISRFRWGASMNLKRIVDDRYLMVMEQSVELVRSGPRKDDTLTMTCDRLEATMDRGAKDAAESGAFDLGGSAEIKRVRGQGRCFIRTAQYDVECESFDYDTVTQIAELTARPGRLVNVLPKGQGAPVRAASMVWDLASGRIQIRSGSGALGGS